MRYVVATLLLFMVLGFVPKDTKLVIYSSQPLTEEDEIAIYTGLSNLFDDVSQRGYKNKIKHADYTVTIRHDCTKMFDEYAWTERLDEYNGSIYDTNPDPKIGETRVRELVEPPSTNILICRDTPEKMYYSTRYGGEHIILYHNDRKEFERTRVHTQIQHPIIPENR